MIQIDKEYIFINEKPVLSCSPDEYKLQLERENKTVYIKSESIIKVIGIQTISPPYNTPYLGSNPWIYFTYNYESFKTCFDNIKNNLKEYIYQKPLTRFELICQ